MLRKKLAARGARGILGLGKLFRIIDDDRSGQLDEVEFKKALKEYKMNIDDPDIEALYKLFDTDHSGQIHYDEFLRAVRVPLIAHLLGRTQRFPPTTRRARLRTARRE
jgi:hypothetical protein